MTTENHDSAFRSLTNPLPKFLKELSARKGSNLCLSVSKNVTTVAALFDAVAAIGHLIVLLTINPEHIQDWSQRTSGRLLKLAQEKEFLILDHGLQSRWTPTTQEPPKITRWAQVVELDISNDSVEDTSRAINDLRDAFRSADWSAKGEVRTEIAAERDSSEDVDSGVEVDVEDVDVTEEEDVVPEPDTNHFGSPNSLGPEEDATLRARKASVISLTSTLTQTAVEATPPTSATTASDSKRRGVILNLRGNDSVSEDSCLELIRQNRDIVVGFISTANESFARLAQSAPPEGVLLFEKSDTSLTKSSAELVADAEKAVSHALTKAVPDHQGSSFIVVSI